MTVRTDPAEPRPGQDVAEACADALLAACAQALVLRQPVTGSTEISIDAVWELAHQTLEQVIARTYSEGARPR